MAKERDDSDKEEKRWSDGGRRYRSTEPSMKQQGTDMALTRKGGTLERERESDL